jgi:hypothetical protein
MHNRAAWIAGEEDNDMAQGHEQSPLANRLLGRRRLAGQRAVK